MGVVMMARRGVFGLLAGGIAMMTGGCGSKSAHSFRFKMTVEVESSAGLITGYSVYEVKGVATKDLVSNGKGSRVVLSGEAAAVDLLNGQTLFAILRMASATSEDDNLAIMAMRAMDSEMSNASKHDSVGRIASKDGIASPVEVPTAYYPMLVMFRDINNPKTVTQVNPVSLGVKRIVVEVTNEPVTKGIQKRLSWLSGHQGSLSPRDDGRLNWENPERDLTPRAFKQGLEL